MPTRKQRRRRAKDRRHEWEYVYVDDEGREVEVDEPEAATPKPRAATPRGKPVARAKAGSSASGMRKVDPPSWNRVAKRAAIFAPFMFIVVYYVGRNSTGHSIPIALYYTVVMVLVFMPFTYMIDSMMYRAYRRRIGDPLPPRERRPRAPKG
jgi:hypothetical protein